MGCLTALYPPLLPLLPQWHKKFFAHARWGGVGGDDPCETNVKSPSHTVLASKACGYLTRCFVFHIQCLVNKICVCPSAMVEKRPTFTDAIATAPQRATRIVERKTEALWLRETVEIEL
jgi:hypothetical protein